MKYSKRRRGLEQKQESAQPVMTPFDKALKAFLDGQDAAGHSKISWRDYKCVVGLFLRHMSGVHQYTCIEEITEADVLGWLACLRNGVSRRGKPYSSRSIQTYSIYVFTFFSWLHQHGYVDFNPAAGLKAPKVDNPIIRLFSEEELKALDMACDRALKGKALTPDERKALASRDRAVLWLLLSTGIRVSELCGLRFCDVDWDAGMIVVFGKGSKERRVPFGPVARQHLNTYLQYWRGQPDDPVYDSLFLSAFGKPLTDYAVQESFRRLKRIAGIRDKRVTPHICRHWFAVNAIKQGMPTIVLKELLGHATWEMIQVYVQLAEQDNRDLYMRYSPVDSLPMHRSTQEKRGQIRAWRNARKRKDRS